jgi:CBS domain-containing protein
MKVKDIMTSDLRTCAPETSAAAAAQLMWDADCGILPVVDAGRLVGVVTDRDLYIALATQNCLASELRVGDVTTGRVVTCEPEDDIHEVMEAMKAHRVRRMPVLGFAGAVIGIVSIDDVVREAGPRRVVSNEEVIGTLKGIYSAHRAPDIVAV